MKHITFLMACFLLFVGTVKAQEAATTDYATAEGVVPALSTSGGIQYAYYLRNVKFPKSFLGVTNTAAAGGTATVTTDVSNAVKVAIEKTSNGFTLYTLLPDGTRSGNKIKSGESAPMMWVDNKSDDIYQWRVQYVDADEAFTFYSTKRSKYLWAPAETNTQNKDVTSTLMYGSFSRYVQHMGWNFIPANEAAEQARDLTLTVQNTGDAVHGNVATFSASYPVTTPEGYTAYTAQYKESENCIEMTPLTGSVIPANTGVLVKGAAGTPAMKPSLLDAGESVSANAFVSVGDVAHTFGSEDTQIYLLGRQDGIMCFRLMNTDGTQTIAAHKAYIDMSAQNISAESLASLRFNFDGTSTSIGNVEVSHPSSAPYYDLSGRRVTQPAQGIYIQNGKKIIVK